MADGAGRGAAWLTHVVRISRAPIPWLDVVRVAVSIVAPVALGVALAGVAGSGKAIGTDPVDPDRAAVGAVFTAIGKLLAASGTGRATRSAAA